MIGKGGTSTHVEALSLGCFQTRDVFDGQVAQYVFESHDCGESNVMKRRRFQFARHTHRRGHLIIGQEEPICWLQEALAG